MEEAEKFIPTVRVARMVPFMNLAGNAMGPDFLIVIDDKAQECALTAVAAAARNVIIPVSVVSATERVITHTSVVSATEQKNFMRTTATTATA